MVMFIGAPVAAESIPELTVALSSGGPIGDGMGRQFGSDMRRKCLRDQLMPAFIPMLPI